MASQTRQSQRLAGIARYEQSTMGVVLSVPSQDGHGQVNENKRAGSIDGQQHQRTGP